MGYQVTNQYGAILVNDESTLNEPKEIRFITPEYREKFKLPMAVMCLSVAETEA